MYILNRDFTNNFESLKQYFDKIKDLASSLNNLEFQIGINHINLNLRGIIDIIENNNKIIELKFVKNINEKHIIQTLLYYNILYPNDNIKYLEIWNLLDGYKYIINFENINNWQLNLFLSEMLDQKMINNIFMLDLETNTINPNDDFTNPINTEIIDRFIYEYSWKEPISDGLIKCKYPLTTSHITGIIENDLINADNSIDNFKNEINILFKYCEKPIFVAHNGKKFDFPILYYYKILNKNNIRILDSLEFIRLIKPNCSSRTNKLIDLYNNICNESYEQTHRAKDDTMLIVNICKKLNMNQLNFLLLF